MSRPENEGNGGFLSRWSRLKQDARQPAAEAASAPSPAIAAEPPTALDAGEREPETKLPLPSLDDIVPGGDVTAFFQKHVPDALRTAALRKLWVTDPEIKGFIEMADYQWDFTNPDTIPGWSSKLEGVDVKALAERIFGELPRPGDAQALKQVSAEASEPSGKTDDRDAEGLPEPPDSSIGSITYAAPSTIVEGVATADAAVQKNGSESDAYPPARKRHGSALPT